MKARNLVSPSSTESNEPRVRNVRTRMLSQMSIWLRKATLLRRGVKDDGMRGIAHKRCTTGQRSQHTTVAFDPHILLDATPFSNETDQSLGLMDMEMVTDHLPARRVWIGSNHGLQMGENIFLRACGSTKRRKVSSS